MSGIAESCQFRSIANGRHENPACLVEQAVNAALNDAFDEAEALLLERFASVSLADLAADFARRHKAHIKKETP